MKKPVTYLLFVFIFFCFVNVIANSAGWDEVILVTKPLLMPALAAWFYFASEEALGRLWQFVLLALFFSWMGDCFLLFVGEQPHFFLLGLGSFLIAHLFYITAFLRYPGWRKGWVVRQLWPAVPVLIFLGFMIAYLWPDLPKAFKIPVGVYSVVIVLMLLSAMNMRGRMGERAARFLTFGALLFVLSDSLIAIGKFKSTGISPEFFSVGIMTTYLAGQFLIVGNCRRL